MRECYPPLTGACTKEDCMTLVRLHDILGETIESIHNTNENSKAFELATKKAEYEAKIAKQIINNADIILRTDKLSNRCDRIDTVVGK
jgi:hypothetical protein